MKINLHSALSTVVAGNNAVDQSDGVLSAFEGDEVTIACHYETSNPTASLLWYKQTANGFPEFMLITFTYTGGQTEEKFKERFHSKVNSTSKSAPLKIQNLQSSDSAVYYCAMTPTVTTLQISPAQKQQRLH